MKIRTLFALVALFLPMRSFADVTLLIHGYLSDGTTWERSGIVAVLAAHGWHFAGHLTPGQTLAPAAFDSRGANSVYVVDLPSTAPLMWQSDLLEAQLNKVRAYHQDEPITLVGHSAGGVTARLTLVRFGARNIDHLITIAAPHQGTPRAGEGLSITDNSGLLEPVKSIFGGDIYQVAKRSRALYYDLTPPHPGNILFWLNMQPHPQIRYTSVLRIQAPNGEGDDIVPSFSQDMNQVPGLRGQSAILTTPAPHYLRQQDGISLVQLLTHDVTQK